MREYKHLGLFLKKARQQQKLTQQELSEEFGFGSNQYVSNWERGTCPPPSHSFQKLIKILKINRQELAKTMLEDEIVIIRSKVYQKGKGSKAS